MNSLISISSEKFVNKPKTWNEKGAFNKQDFIMLLEMRFNDRDLIKHISNLVDKLVSPKELVGYSIQSLYTYIDQKTSDFSFSLDSVPEFLSSLEAQIKIHNQFHSLYRESWELIMSFQASLWLNLRKIRSSILENIKKPLLSKKDLLFLREKLFLYKELYLLEKDYIKNKEFIIKPWQEKIKNNIEKMLWNYEEVNIEYINETRTILESYIKAYEISLDIVKDNTDINNSLDIQYHNQEPYYSFFKSFSLAYLQYFYDKYPNKNISDFEKLSKRSLHLNEIQLRNIMENQYPYIDRDIYVKINEKRRTNPLEHPRISKAKENLKEEINISSIIQKKYKTILWCYILLSSVDEKLELKNFLSKLWIKKEYITKKLIKEFEKMKKSSSIPNELLSSDKSYIIQIFKSYPLSKNKQSINLFIKMKALWVINSIDDIYDIFEWENWLKPWWIMLNKLIDKFGLSEKTIKSIKEISKHHLDLNIWNEEIENLKQLLKVFLMIESSWWYNIDIYSWESSASGYYQYLVGNGKFVENKTLKRKEWNTSSYETALKRIIEPVLNNFPALKLEKSKIWKPEDQNLKKLSASEQTVLLISDLFWNPKTKKLIELSLKWDIYKIRELYIKFHHRAPDNITLKLIDDKFIELFPWYDKSKARKSNYKIVNSKNTTRKVSYKLRYGKTTNIEVKSWDTPWKLIYNLIKKINPSSSFKNVSEVVSSIEQTWVIMINIGDKIEIKRVLNKGYAYQISIKNKPKFFIDEEKKFIKIK